jgi:hypothetical protein
VQPETHIRGNKNKKKIKQADFPAKAPESSSDKCETDNAERSMHDLSGESPEECFPESYDRAKNDGSTNQAEKHSAPWGIPSMKTAREGDTPSRLLICFYGNDGTKFPKISGHG